jgi:hypothetical protein
VFIGHFGASFGLKGAGKTISLGWLFFAAQYPDILWSILVSVGVEKASIVPGARSMKKKVEWKSRHSDGQAFPVVPKGDKKNLPTTLKLQDIPADSHLHEDMNNVSFKYANGNARSKKRISEEELLLLGIEELQARGLELGVDFHVTEKEGLTVGTTVRLREKGTKSSSGGSKDDKWQEMGWMPESVRRAKAQKMTKSISAGLKAPHK